jgi:hypothetical protein
MDSRGVSWGAPHQPEEQALPQATTSADEGGPAPRLRLAPDEIRCGKTVLRSDGRRERCSRFTIRLAKGDRDRFCVAHSNDAHAKALRAKGQRAQRIVDQEERERLEQLAGELVPKDWERKSSFQQARLRLYGAVVRGDVTVQQGGLLRLLIVDAERHVQRHNSWVWSIS